MNHSLLDISIRAQLLMIYVRCLRPRWQTWCVFVFSDFLDSERGEERKKNTDAHIFHVCNFLTLTIGWQKQFNVNFYIRKLIHSTFGQRLRLCKQCSIFQAQTFLWNKRWHAIRCKEYIHKAIDLMIVCEHCFMCSIPV